MVSDYRIARFRSGSCLVSVRIFLIFAVLLSFSSSALAEIKNIAVLEYRGVGIEGDYLLHLSDQTRSAAVKLLSKDAYLILTRENMMQILSDNGKEAACMEGSCEIEIGRNIGADYIITGNILQIEGMYVLNLKLYETKTGGLLATQEIQNQSLLLLKDQTFQQSKLLLEEGLPIRNLSEGKRETSSKKERPGKTQQRETAAKSNQHSPVFFEVGGGAAFGDIDRSFDTRVGFESDADTIFAVYQYDTFTSGVGSVLGGSIGYALSNRVEFLLHGGFISGETNISTGWEQRGEHLEVLDSDESRADPITSSDLYLAPKIRYYVLKNQMLRPYLLTGAYFRWFDELYTEDLQTVSYPDRPGGTHYGLNYGLGLSLEGAKSPARLFVELPLTYVFNQVPYQYLAEQIQNIPLQPSSSNQILRIQAGISFYLP